MAGSMHYVVTDSAARGRPFWLPPGGWGNGIDSDMWIAILDVRGELPATLLLLELRDAKVPGHAGVFRPPYLRATARPEAESRRVRIWVGAEAYGRGESTILRAMPALLRQFGPTLLS